MGPLSFFSIILVSLIICYGLRLWFTRLQKFDAINHRSVHKAKATKTGGIAVFLTLFLFSTYYYLYGIQLYDFSLLIPLGIMFIMGVYDDFYNADFKLKFFLQIIVAKILIDQGLLIENFHGVLGLQEIPRLAAQLFTVFVILVIVNAINFIDGIDGLAITEGIKVVLLVEFFSVQSTALFLWGDHGTQSSTSTILILRKTTRFFGRCRFAIFRNFNCYLSVLCAWIRVYF